MEEGNIEQENHDTRRFYGKRERELEEVEMAGEERAEGRSKRKGGKRKLTFCLEASCSLVYNIFVFSSRIEINLVRSERL